MQARVQAAARRLGGACSQEVSGQAPLTQSRHASWRKVPTARVWAPTRRWAGVVERAAAGQADWRLKTVERYEAPGNGGRVALWCRDRLAVEVPA